MSVLIALLAMALPDDATPASADPLEPAKRGMMLCQAPDDTKKTCKSLVSYTAKPDGSFASDATLLISPQGPVTLRTQSVVHEKNNSVCSTLTTKQIDKMQVFFAGQLIPPERAWGILDRIEDAMTPFIGKELCASYAPGENGQLVSTGSVGGAPRPELKQNVRWVGASDGYTVAP